MAKTKKQGENSACSALFERAYYSSGYGILIQLLAVHHGADASDDDANQGARHWEVHFQVRGLRGADPGHGHALADDERSGVSGQLGLPVARMEFRHGNIMISLIRLA